MQGWGHEPTHSFLLQPQAVPWKGWQDPKSSHLSLEKGTQEKSWGLGMAAKANSKFEEGADMSR